MPTIQDLILAVVLMQPCEFRKDCMWVGFRSYTIGMVNGLTIKTVVWPKQIVLEVGLWNTQIWGRRVW